MELEIEVAVVSSFGQGESLSGAANAGAVKEPIQMFPKSKKGVVGDSELLSQILVPPKRQGAKLSDDKEPEIKPAQQRTSNKLGVRARTQENPTRWDKRTQ